MGTNGGIYQIKETHARNEMSVSSRASYRLCLEAVPLCE